MLYFLPSFCDRPSEPITVGVSNGVYHAGPSMAVCLSVPLFNVIVVHIRHILPRFYLVIHLWQQQTALVKM